MMDDAVTLPYSVHLADLETVLRRQGVIRDDVSLRDKPKPQKKNKGGRPEEYPWDEAKAAVLDHIKATGRLFSKPAATQDWVSTWFSKKGGEPAHSAIKKFVKDLIAKSPPGTIVKAQN